MDLVEVEIERRVGGEASWEDTEETRVREFGERKLGSQILSGMKQPQATATAIVIATNNRDSDRTEELEGE